MNSLAFNGAEYLLAQSASTLLALYWFVVIFEIPRYTLLFAVAAFGTRSERSAEIQPATGRVAALIAGHNEAESIETCVRALHEQSRPPDEIIIVSDGSTDQMPAKMRELQLAGLVHGVHSTDLRSGKSAGVNLAGRTTQADFIAIVDCDCTFDRHAIRNALAHFEDPDLGGISGNVLVRNAAQSLVTRFQAIEYLISISLGRIGSDHLNAQSCISGAFGVYRRRALEETGWHDAGGGEDLDQTLRLRKAGWRVGFAPHAVCYTDVPETFEALLRQRFRWERDAVALRYRKHRDLISPFSSRLAMADLFHELEFLLFNVIAAAALPFYLLWLFNLCGMQAFTVLLGAQIGLLVLDMMTFLLAAHAMPRAEKAGLLPYLLGYSLFNGLIMRTVRLAAYVQEWVFRASYQDSYCPDKVQLERY